MTTIFVTLILVFTEIMKTTAVLEMFCSSKQMSHLKWQTFSTVTDSTDNFYCPSSISASVYSKLFKGTKVCCEHGEGLLEGTCFSDVWQTVCFVFLWRVGEGLQGGVIWTSVSWLYNVCKGSCSCLYVWPGAWLKASGMWWMYAWLRAKLRISVFSL